MKESVFTVACLLLAEPSKKRAEHPTHLMLLPDKSRYTRPTTLPLVEYQNPQVSRQLGLETPRSVASSTFSTNSL